MMIYEILFRFLADGAVSGIASKSATFVDGSAVSIGIAQPMDYAQFAAAFNDTDLVALGAAVQAELNARGNP